MKKLYPSISRALLTAILTVGIAGFTTAQNVGVGSATPTEKLDVSGAIRVGNTSSSNAGSIRYITGTQKFQINIAGTWYDIATGNLAYISNFSYNATTNVLTIIEGSTTHTVNLTDLQDNTDDQNLTLTGNNLSIESGNTINLAPFMDNTDNQALSYNATTNVLTLQNGGTVDLTDLQDNTDSQTLSITSNNLAISGGNSVSLLPYLDNTDSQQLTLVSNNLTITGGNTVSLASYVNTDNQTLNLTGNTLAISGGNTVSLASYVNTDAQTLSLSGSNLSISGGNTISMSSFLDNTDSQSLTLSGNNLSISGGNSVSLASYVNTDDQALSYNSITNVVTLEDGGTIDLSDLQDNTDDQNLTLTGNTLSIESGNSVSLSGYLDNTDDQTLSEVYNEGGNTVQLTAADGDVRFFRGSSTEVLNLKESNGFVGIGTTNPTYKLDVTGEIRATSNINGGAHFVGLSGDPYYRTNADNKHIVLSGGSGWTNTAATMVLRGASASNNAHGLEMYTGNAERMRILANGNVGIGTPAPTGNLTVITGGTGTWAPFVVKSTSLWGDGLSSPSETGGTPYVTIGAQAAGIMIANPHVVWTGSAAATRYGRSGGISSGQWWEAGVNGTGGYHIRRTAAEASGIEINTSGNVGVGTSTPAQAMELYRQNLDVAIRFHDPGDYHYAMGIDRSDVGKFKINYGASVGDANHITMTTGGSVGIGSNSPVQALDVAGDINASNGYRIGNGAAAGQYLRGNGSRFVSSAIQVGDIPGGSGNYIQNQWGGNQSANFDITGAAQVGRIEFSGVGGNSGEGNHSYAIFQESGAWSNPYPDLRIAYHTGIKLGAYYGYNGTRFYNNSDMATEIFSVGNGDNLVRSIYGIYSPIVYDYNDAGYYSDPNSTTRHYHNRNNYITTGEWGNYNQFHSWTNLPNHTGLYSSNHNGAHFYPNNGSYGAWRMDGDRNGWYGIEHNTPNAGSRTTLMMGHSSHVWGNQQIGAHNNSHGWLWYFSHQRLYADGLTDMNNNGYYVDPNATSRLSTNITDESYTYGWFRNYTNARGMYHQNTGNHFYSEGNYWNMAKASGNNGLIFRNAYAGTILGYVYSDNGSSFGLLPNNGSWRVRVDNSNVETYGGLYTSTAYTPYQYDRDNTGYYLDLNGNTQMHYVMANNWFRPQGQTGVYWNDYGGGWYMVDGSWIRTYNNRSMLSQVNNSTPAIRGDQASGSYWASEFYGNPYAVYASGYIYATTYGYLSTRSRKHDIEKFETDDYESALAFMDDLELNYYKLNEDTEYNTVHVGFIAEETPGNLATPGKQGVRYGELSIYNTGALKVLKEKVENIESQLKNVSDFGADNIYAPSMWVEFSNEFKTSLGNADPIVVVTPSQTGKTLNLKQITREGFEIENPNNGGVTFSWIAMGKSNANEPKSSAKYTDKFKEMLESAEYEATHRPAPKLSETPVPDVYDPSAPSVPVETVNPRYMEPTPAIPENHDAPTPADGVNVPPAGDPSLSPANTPEPVLQTPIEGIIIPELVPEGENYPEGYPHGKMQEERKND